MKKSTFSFPEALHRLKHYLPAQAPLKDFIHHNTLHAFQEKPFFSALQEASAIFGYKVSLNAEEYRKLWREGRIRQDVLERVIRERKGEPQQAAWMKKLLSGCYDEAPPARVGQLRKGWKEAYSTDLDAAVHPLLFRLLGAFLDQGISIWPFPYREEPLMEALRKLDAGSRSSLFKTQRARRMLAEGQHAPGHLLSLLVGKEALYEQYLFDQQFAHPGWSGLISVVEEQPQTLLDRRRISLSELIELELLLEIDALDHLLGAGNWAPLATRLPKAPLPLFAPLPASEQREVLSLWQEAYEWSYFDQVLAGLREEKRFPALEGPRRFQALFCIDDRCCSIRRHVEQLAPDSETFGTPGFFGVDAYFQPDGGKFHTQICPVPVKPRHLIAESESQQKRGRELHFSKHSHPFHSGWLISQTLGFWAALRLMVNIFLPSASPASASPLKHMDKEARLRVERPEGEGAREGLYHGYTEAEMGARVEQVLRSIGLVKDFGPIVYVVGHGASSVNNPHYAAYDCGACSGRAGSVNARAFAYMANHPGVRAALAARGIAIGEGTHFLGALHDTTRDEMHFFDEDQMPAALLAAHRSNAALFQEALHLNAKERSRRFETVNTRLRPAQIHRRILRRSVSLFEPRPELNHATNALCIVGRRALSRGIFLDRRSFLNSYDPDLDPSGDLLAGILNAVAPVCGGINLEYYFSRVDEQKLGAGSKLPHNVVGLFGVANGIEGDLRPGLPRQMTEVHDPLRLLVVVEQEPERVEAVLRRNPATLQWFEAEWIHLVALDPATRAAWRFAQGRFEPYLPLTSKLERVSDVMGLIESQQENFPVYLIG